MRMKLTEYLSEHRGDIQAMDEKWKTRQSRQLGQLGIDVTDLAKQLKDLATRQQAVHRMVEKLGEAGAKPPSSSEPADSALGAETSASANPMPGRRSSTRASMTQRHSMNMQQAQQLENLRASLSPGAARSERSRVPSGETPNPSQRGRPKAAPMEV